MIYPCELGGHLPAIGRALNVECPRCASPSEEKCKDEEGQTVATHVERARTARWTEMLRL